MTAQGFEATQDRVLRIVQSASAGRALTGTIQLHQDLRDEVGLESMVLMSIAFLLEKEFDIDLTAHGDELAELRTVADLAQFFHRVQRG